MLRKISPLHFFFLTFISSITILKNANAFTQPGFSISNNPKTLTTKLYFGIPTFGGGNKKDNEDQQKINNNNSNEPEKKIGLSGLVQLITAGMGSPFLGDFEGVDEETGNLMFSLEANNLVDENGKSKQTSMPYFESGWVDPADLEKERLRKEKGGWWPF